MTENNDSATMTDLELNAAIAQEILGWKWVHRCGDTKCATWLVPPYFSFTDPRRHGLVGKFENGERPVVLHSGDFAYRLSHTDPETTLQILEWLTDQGGDVILTPRKSANYGKRCGSTLKYITSASPSLARSIAEIALRVARKNKKETAGEP